MQQTISRLSLFENIFIFQIDFDFRHSRDQTQITQKNGTSLHQKNRKTISFLYNQNKWFNVFDINEDLFRCEKYDDGKMNHI